MFKEADLLPISALQHFLYCARQCALIHLERVWTENRFTAEGRVLHERVDQGGEREKTGLRIAYALEIRSLKYGLAGKADVVEFHREMDGSWRPFPVEYKRGRPKVHDADRIQLCAQGLCLEEMKRVHVPQGALFYGKNRRREMVRFDESLRNLTIATALKLHELIETGETPQPDYQSKKCQACSLMDDCLPRIGGKKSPVNQYWEKTLAGLEKLE